MDERELASRIRALSKSVMQNETPESILALMNTLKNDAKPTEEMLRSTKAGVVIGKLRSNANKDIAKLAGEIVAKWRKLVDAEKAAKAQRAKNLGSPSTPTPGSNGSPAPLPQSSSKPYEGDTEKRHFKEDKVDIKRTSSTIRDNCIGMMYNGLAYRATDSVEDVLIRAIEVENAAYKAYKGEGQEYRTKMRSLFINLKNKTNRQLGRKVMSGEITPDHFVVMNEKELASAEQRAKDELLEKENMKKAQVPMAEKSISDALKCGKCGQKKVSYSQAQTRSADEPMTTFCECTVCGNRWKVRYLSRQDALHFFLILTTCSSLDLSTFLAYLQSGLWMGVNLQHGLECYLGFSEVRVANGYQGRTGLLG